MATMEKPMKKKTKKIKVKQKIIPNNLQTYEDEEEEEETIDDIKENIISESSADDIKSESSKENYAPTYVEYENDDIVYKTATSAINKIISHQCNVAAIDCENPTEIFDKNENKTTTSALATNVTENVYIQNDLRTIEKTNDEITNTDKKEENNCVTQTSEPTAPLADAITNKYVPLVFIENNAQYPNIEKLKYMESENKNVIVDTKKVQSTIRSIANVSPKVPWSDVDFYNFYFCADLKKVKEFELEFLMNSLTDAFDNEPLYATLQKYYDLQCKLSINIHDVKANRKDAADAQKQIWTEVLEKKTFIGRCGDHYEVSETVFYNVAKVDIPGFERASAALDRLYDSVCFSYTTNLILAKEAKIKIDQIISELISELEKFEPTKKEICLRPLLESKLLGIIARLRQSVTVLFYFARKISPNKEFDKDLKFWLRQLISIQLLFATKEDHWFILFNILRCPSSVGTWAAELIQIPVCSPEESETSLTQTSEPPLSINSAEIDNCIAMLQVLLFPIKKRDEYLKSFTQYHKDITDPARDDRWILIDSDGEDSHTPTGKCVGLKESDLIALLNQIPFEKVFASAMLLEKFLGDYIIEADKITGLHMIKLIAFFNNLINLFGQGMLNYNTERYKHLAKRLGRLIRHTLQYAADYNELFNANELTKDASTCARIEMELDALLLKGCSYIYSAKNLATWQYFSSLPFEKMNKNALLQIFYYLNVGFPTEFLEQTEQSINQQLEADDFWIKFNVANADSSHEDLYYLLQTFFEMANERDIRKEPELIKTICLHIFNIGFLNKKTRDICYKTSRDMLVNLTLSHIDLLSCLLTQTKIHFADIENVIFLFKSLPLENWKPEMSSFEILSNWLLHYDEKSQENMLSRIIISHLNWMFDSDGRLFLPRHIHVRMACLVTEALTKHAPEVCGYSGISESVRQVTNLLDFTQTTKEQFTDWCWCIISVLRLHLMDQNVESIKRMLQNPSETLLLVPDLENIDRINQGVSESCPIAIYVALLTSLHGHSIPLICQKGFDLMKQLLNDHRHAAVIRCIELIVPIFLETPETLANCESFHGILNSILNADKTYLKMAKDIIYPNAVGPVLELFDNMLHHQITTYSDYGLSTPLNLINVWLNCLTALPNWQNTAAVYLLDKIIRVAYQFPDARGQTVQFFLNYYKNCIDWKGTSKMSSIKGFFTTNQTPIPALSPSNGWLALLLLDIEFQLVDAKFWTQFLWQLSTIREKDLGEILKKTTATLKMNSFPVQMLVVYKYADLIVNMEANHPTLPILCQKFFELFLSRLPYDHNDERFTMPLAYGFSDKFYEYNVPLMKKIKNSFKMSEHFYANEAIKEAKDEALSYVYRNCASIMKSFALWLEETSINKTSTDALDLPPQYNKQKLIEILNGNTTHWTEFIYLPEIRKVQKLQSEQWARKCHRIKYISQPQNPLQRKSKSTAEERIKKHLRSYDKRLKAPKYLSVSASIPRSIDSCINENVKQKLLTLNQCASKFHFKFAELNSLNGNYLDTVKELYKMVPYEEVKLKSCNSLIFNRKCTSPASITTVVQQIRRDEAVERKLKCNRDQQNKMIDELLKINIDDFSDVVEYLTAVVRLLVQPLNTATDTQKDFIKSGSQLFFEIIENINETSMKFQPACDFYHRILCELGSFLHEDQEKQGLPILELTFQRPELLTILSGVFVPYRTRPDYFIKMYKYLVQSHMKRCDNKILFVLLSKFDMYTWLAAFKPKVSDIHSLLKLILHGLECWSLNVGEPQLLQDLFRRHLLHVFNYNFPQHFGNVLQLVFEKISDKKIMPIVLFDLLNAVLSHFNCDHGNFNTTPEEMEAIARDFASKQNLFTLKSASDTIHILAGHFRKERLSHGLHGLYPKHKDYCVPIAFWFSLLSHTLVCTAICTYQDYMADQISDIVFAAVVDLYSPWIIPYNEFTMAEPSANWIRQLIENGKVLNPYTEQHANLSKIIIKSYVGTLQFVLDCLTGSDTILKHVFAWYVHHFTLPGLDAFLFGPIHESLNSLPWDRYKPQSDFIDMMHESLQRFAPQAHAMLGRIFLQIKWKSWFSDHFYVCPPNIQIYILNHLFTIFIKLSFEPSIHSHISISRILEDAIQYPWEQVEYAELDHLLTWLLHVVDPKIILTLPTESNYADRAVLQMISKASSMSPDPSLKQRTKNDCGKRILYTRSVVRMLRICTTKHHKLIATKDGQHAFHLAVQDLLNCLNKCIESISSTHTIKERNCEALNLLIEIMIPMQCQSEESSSYFVKAMIDWQQKCPAGNILMINTISALGHMKNFIYSVYALLENSIANYFRSSEPTKDWHQPTWVSLISLLLMSLDKLELTPIITGGHFLTLHTFILHKLGRIKIINEKITFLQDVIQLVESAKIDPMTEPRIALVWGVIISRSCGLILKKINIIKPLRLMAHSMQILSTQAESWSDNLLGAIGLKKETITNRRKVLTRSLACLIFSLFPETTQSNGMIPNEEFNSALRELSMLLANKKFIEEKPLIVDVVNILNENKTPKPCDVPQLTSRIISIFYENCFLTTISEIWSVDYNLQDVAI